MKHLFAAALLAVSVAGCGRQAPKPDERVDAIARDYVLLSLEIGEKEEGYIDAYYGPSDLQERATAEAAKLSLPELAKRTKDLQARVAAVPAEGDSLDARRVRAPDPRSLQAPDRSFPAASGRARRRTTRAPRRRRRASRPASS